MATIKSVRGNFSTVTGSDTRIVYSPEGSILGTVHKLSDKRGYKVVRIDGKIRTKPTLAEAYRTIRRSN